MAQKYQFSRQSGGGHSNQPRTVYVGAPQSQALPALANALCWPGIGQLIQGRVLAAVCWYFGFLAAVGSIFLLVGLVIAPLVWIACIVDAARWQPSMYGGRSSGGSGGAGGVLLGVLGIGAAGVGMLVMGLVVMAQFSTPTERETSEVGVAVEPAREAEERTEVQPPPPSSPSPARVEPSTFSPTPTISVPPLPTITPPIAEHSDDEGPAFEPTPTMLELPNGFSDDDDEETTPQPPPSPGIRTWTDSSGKFKIVATYEKFERNAVTIRKEDGTLITLPLDKFSADDQRWVREWRSGKR